MALDDTRMTPAHLRNDGHNYHPTHRWVLFGHHFAAITGAGPLIGPVLAAQFGLAPGPHLAGRRRLPGRRGPRLHHPVGLDAPRRPLARRDRPRRDRAGRRRHRGRRHPVHHRHRAGRPRPRGRQRAARRAPGARSPSATSIPLALFMGLYMYRFRKGRIAEATVIGVVGLLLAVDPRQADRRLGVRAAASSCRANELIVAMARLRLRRVGAAGLAAALPARLPQLVHEDRHDRALVVGVIVVNPELQMPAFSAVRRRRRADHSRAALSLRLHHHRLRRDLRLPRADRVRAPRRR